MVVRNAECSFAQLREEEGNFIIRLDALVETHGNDRRRDLTRHAVCRVLPIPLGGDDKTRVIHQQPQKCVIKYLTDPAKRQAPLGDLLDLAQETRAADLAVRKEMVFGGDLEDTEPHRQCNGPEDLPAEIRPAAEARPLLGRGFAVEIERRESISEDELAEPSDLGGVLGVQVVAVVDPQLQEPLLHDGLDDEPWAPLVVFVPSPDELRDEPLVAEEIQDFAALRDALARDDNGGFLRDVVGGFQIWCCWLEDAEAFGEDAEL